MYASRQQQLRRRFRASERQQLGRPERRILMRSDILLRTVCSSGTHHSSMDPTTIQPRM
jgi:hypothetical protein